VATEPWQVDDLRAGMEQSIAAGEEVTWLDRDAIRAEVDSPTYLAGTWQRSGEAMVDPARLAWGLADACRRLGVEIHEGTALSDIDRAGAALSVRTATGATIRSGALVLATNAFPSPVRRI